MSQCAFNFIKQDSCILSHCVCVCLWWGVSFKAEAGVQSACRAARRLLFSNKNKAELMVKVRSVLNLCAGVVGKRRPDFF